MVSLNEPAELVVDTLFRNVLSLPSPLSAVASEELLLPPPPDPDTDQPVRRERPCIFVCSTPLQF